MLPCDRIEGQGPVVGDVRALQSVQSTEKDLKIVDFGHLDVDLKANVLLLASSLSSLRSWGGVTVGDVGR